MREADTRNEVLDTNDNTRGHAFLSLKGFSTLPKSPPLHPLPKRDAGLPLKVAVAIFCRIALNTARRFAYPFAPVLSRALEVPITAVTRLIATNEVPSVFGVFFGPIIDRLGYRKIMLTGLVLLSLGMLSAAFLPLYWIIWAAFLLAGFGKSLFDPAVQAYASEQVPYRRRGLVIGLLEFSWAGSTLVGIPMIGILIDRVSWRAPFFVLGFLGAVGFITLILLIPPEPAKPNEVPRKHNGIRLKTVFSERTSLGALGFGFFLSISNNNLFVVYGAWLEHTFGLSITALGLGTAAIGIAELLGESLTALFADRLGLKLAVLTGVLISTCFYAIFPSLEINLTLALAGLFFIFLSFEFTIVSSFSLCTELLPQSRGTMMAAFFAAAGAGRVIGSLLGGTLWLAGGILATITVSVISNGFAFVSLFWGLRHWHHR